MAEQRYQAVMAVVGDGLSISQVAEKVGVSRQPLHAPNRGLSSIAIWVGSCEVAAKRAQYGASDVPYIARTRMSVGFAAPPAHVRI